jgi:hypothetical protein
MEPTEANLQSFDEPAFKSAVCRAWGDEQCPAALRERVMSAVAAVPATVRPSFWQQPWLRYGLAAAAMMLIGFGIASRLDRSGRDNLDLGVGGTEVTFASTVPQPIAQGLLESHDRCSKYPSHNGFPALTPDNFAAMRRKLEETLKFPVLAGNVEEALGRNGWKFKGAAICKVGDVDAAHLVFVRNDQAISIFSLPPDSCRHAGNKSHECEDANPDHPVAVFVWSDGVHCVVGSSTDRSLSVDQVRSVLEHLRPTLPGSPAR